MPAQAAFTALLNRSFGGAVTSILHAVHVQPRYPAAPITDAFAMEILVFGLLVVFFLAVRISLSVENPNAVQQTAEAIHGFVSGQAESIIGHGSQRYVVFVTCVLLFIFVGNILGIAPGLISPTASPTVPLGIALLTFLYYHYHGLREQGAIGYVKQFMGPLWWISWMMLPIEFFSHLARILSLTVRLYANIFAGSLVTLVFFSLIPFAIPVVFLSLHLFVAGIQAFIFMLLAMIYLAGAVAHEH